MRDVTVFAAQELATNKSIHIEILIQAIKIYIQVILAIHIGMLRTFLLFR